MRKSSSSPERQILPFNLVAIWWQDAYVTTNDNPKLEGERLTISVGTLVEENNDFIILSHFYDGINDGEMGSPFTSIPKGMVKKVVVYDRDQLQKIGRLITPSKTGKDKKYKISTPVEKSNIRPRKNRRRNKQSNSKSR